MFGKRLKFTTVHKGLWNILFQGDLNRFRVYKGQLSHRRVVLGGSKSSESESESVVPSILS